MLRQRSYLTEGKQLRGYKVMRIQGGRLVSGADSRQSFPAKKGKIKMRGKGIYMSPNKRYVLDYYSGLADDEVLLTFKFDKKNITFGNLTDRESETTVKEASIVKIEEL